MNNRGFIRIATWNLERPKERGWSRNPKIVKKISGVNADIWVLTETNSIITSGLGSNTVASVPIPDYHSSGENTTTITSRWKITEQIDTFDPNTAVCAIIDSPTGPIIVYGTIITYANDNVLPYGKSKRWEEHKKEIEKHRVDWLRIKSEFPNLPFIVAGDFNQSRDGSGWYEDKESVQKLTDALQDCSLVCLTEEDMMKNGKLKYRNTVDHICVSKSLASNQISVSAWDGKSDEGKMSDHNGVSVDLSKILLTAASDC